MAAHVELSQDGLIPLDALPFRSQGVVAEVRAVSEAFRARLAAMGFVPGSGVRMLGAAPLGDPYSVRICGYTLSLRRDEARQVWVTPLAVGDAAAGSPKN